MSITLLLSPLRAVLSGAVFLLGLLPTVPAVREGIYFGYIVNNMPKSSPPPPGIRTCECPGTIYIIYPISPLGSGGWLSNVVLVLLWVVECVLGAKVSETLEQMFPFSRVRYAGDAECIGAAHIADYCLVVGECHYVPCKDNVVYTN